MALFLDLLKVLVGIIIGFIHECALSGYAAGSSCHHGWLRRGTAGGGGALQAGLSAAGGAI